MRMGELASSRRLVPCAHGLRSSTGPLPERRVGTKSAWWLEVLSPMLGVRMSVEEVRDSHLGVQTVHVEVLDPPMGIRASHVGFGSHMRGSEPIVVPLSIFTPRTHGSIGHVPKRGAGPEASGPIRRVRIHGLGCLVPQHRVTHNHAGICLDTIRDGTLVTGYQQYQS